LGNLKREIEIVGSDSYWNSEIKSTFQVMSLAPLVACEERILEKREEGNTLKIQEHGHEGPAPDR